MSKSHVKDAERFVWYPEDVRIIRKGKRVGAKRPKAGGTEKLPAKRGKAD